MISQDVQAVILAAGKSSRLNTGRTKLLEPICGLPMILYPAKLLNSFGIHTIMVVGDESESLRKETSDLDCEYIIQEKKLGTGNAVLCTKNQWDKDNILVLNGDVPLITNSVIEKLYRKHKQSDATISFVSTTVLDPTGYGRIIEDGSIIEDKDCSEKQLEIDLINAGIYLIKRDFLDTYIGSLKKSEVSNEYYITELVNIAITNGEKVETVTAPYDYVRGVNTLEELWIVEQIKRSELIKKWMANGVRFELAQNVHIDHDVEIGRGSLICSGAHLINGSVIGSNCIIGRFSIIKNSNIDNDTEIYSHTVINDSSIGNNCKVGPFAHMRNSVIIANNVVIGNFVEVKKSSIDSNTKAKHLSYLGDSTIGKNVNIGAGTITCNHDGFNKHKTKIEDGAYVGSNNTLIAPVTIGKKSFTAAGSTISNNVPENDLAIARARQENKAGYAEKLRNKHTSLIKSNKTTDKSDPAKKIDDVIRFYGAIKTDNISEL